MNTRRPRVSTHILVTAIGISLVPLGAFAQSQHGQDKEKVNCAELLSSMSAGMTPRIPALPAKDKRALEQVRAEIKTLPGTVVYLPSQIDGKVAFVRLEANPSRQSVDEQYLAGIFSPVDFKKWVYAARLSSNTWAREKLAAMLPPHTDADLGKTVLFVDQGEYQILPGAFQRDGALVVASGSLKRAVESSKQLQLTAASGNFRVGGVFGIPESPGEYRAAFKEEPSDTARFGTLQQWTDAATSARQLVEEHPIEVLAGLGRESTSKGSVLRALEQVNGIVFIVAHSSGAKLVLPSGERIEISPQDISELHLANRPFVFLRVCYGGDNGFAQAFLKAGAGTVWTNRGPMDVNNAVSQATIFFKSLSKGSTFGAAVKVVLDSSNISAESTSLSAHVIRTSQRGFHNDDFE